jgi:sodium-dependent dicarboxylate transporter 2/3/5
VAGAMWFLPTHGNPAARHAIAIAAAMIVLWATEAVPHAFAGILGVFVFWALRIGSFEAAFSGFAVEATWFLLGAIVIGAMARKSRLAERIAYLILSRVGPSYSRLLLAFVVVDFLLTFLIPSGVARVTVLAAIVAGLVQALGFGPRTNIARGLLIVVTYTAGIFDKMIIAGAGSILARGIIQQVAKVPVLYSQWFIAYLPCDVITILCCWRLILWLYPPEAATMEAGTAYLQKKLADLGPYSTAEKRCLLILAIAMTLWMTDFMHHQSPALVSVAVALIAVAPTIGILDGRDLRALNLGAVVFTATALGMSRVLADTKGLEVLTKAMVGWMTPLIDSPVSAALVLYWTAFVYHVFLGNDTTMLSSSLPAVLTFAQAKGLDPLPIGMIWTFGGGGKLFAYQSGVLMVGYAYGYFDAVDLLKVGFLLTIIESLILLALVPLYWPLVGLF